MVCAVRQQCITWTNIDPDLCYNTTSLGHKDSIANKFCLDDLISSDYNLDGEDKRKDRYYAWQVAGIFLSCNPCNQVDNFRFNGD